MPDYPSPQCAFVSCTRCVAALPSFPHWPECECVFAPVCVHCLCISRQALFANNGVACVWLLQTLLSDQASLKRLLFETEDEPTRNALAKLLSQVRGVLWLCTSRCASCLC